MKRILLSILLAIASPAIATSYYISPTGSNTDGKSFATAWREFDRIQGLAPGDTIYIGQGSYKTAPRIETAGVVLRKSRLSGYDGPVVIDCANGAQFRLWAKNITLDGVDAATFTVKVARSDGNPCIYVGYGSYDAAGTIIRNVTFQGVNQSATAAGVGVGVYSDGVTIANCRFAGNPGEDQLCMFQGGLVEGCEFTGQTDSGTSVHRDVISVYPGPSGSQKLTIKGNYFHDSETDTIILLTDYQTVYSQVEISGNAWWGVDTCLKWDTRNPTNGQTRIAVSDNSWGNASVWFAGGSNPAITETGTRQIAMAPRWPPDQIPTQTPVPAPTIAPTAVPTPAPTNTPKPTPKPTAAPTATPTAIPTATPTPQVIHLKAGEYKITIERIEQ